VDKSPETLVSAFKNEYIETVSNDMLEYNTNDLITISETVPSIDSKNMVFLWKQYLNAHNLPNVVYSHLFLKIMKSLCVPVLELNDETNEYIFLNVTSQHLPAQKEFLEFWNKYVNVSIEHNKYVNCYGEFVDELEADEIVNKLKSVSQSKYKKLYTSDNVIRMLKHFYPDLIIENNKHVLYASFNQEKVKNLNGFLENYKTIAQTQLMQEDNANIEAYIDAVTNSYTDELYDAYKTETMKTEQSCPIVCSKRYFDNYLNWWKNVA